MGPGDFRTWFLRERRRLRALDPADAVDEIHARLQTVDPRLEAEVSEGSPRELILSAGGRLELFGLVDELARNLGDAEWTVIALKPARGFAFVFERDGRSVDVGALRFDPLTSEAAPEGVGLRLYAPASVVDIVGPAARFLLEIGLGERESPVIAHVEVVAADPLPEDAIPLPDLAAYIAWKRRQR